LEGRNLDMSLPWDDFEYGGFMPVKLVEEPWPDLGRGRIRFNVEMDGEQYKFAITREAINDRLRTEDTMGQAMHSFEKHLVSVLELSVQAVTTIEPDEDGVRCMLSDWVNARWF
jgi:hypothetical protein